MSIPQKYIDRFHQRYTISTTNFYNNTPCWEWTGSLSSKNYGIIYTTHTGKSFAYLAHRLSYEVHNEPPGELCVCHHCDNPRCVNPEHLFLGTRSDNNLDRTYKGRTVNNPPKGEQSDRAILTEQQVIDIRSRLYYRGFYNDLAEEFNVVPQTISSAYNRINWKHI